MCNRFIKRQSDINRQLFDLGKPIFVLNYMYVQYHVGRRSSDSYLRLHQTVRQSSCFSRSLNCCFSIRNLTYIEKQLHLHYFNWIDISLRTDWFRTCFENGQKRLRKCSLTSVVCCRFGSYAALKADTSCSNLDERA